MSTSSQKATRRVHPQPQHMHNLSNARALPDAAS